MSPWTKSPRKLIALACGIALAALALAVATAPRGHREDGPLQQAAKTGIELPVNSDETITWGIALPLNRSPHEINLTAAEPIEVQGLDILGVLVHDPAIDGGIGTAYGHPPEGVLARPVAGARLPPGRTSGWSLEVLVGVRRPQDSAVGTIGGLRVTYTADGQDYQVVLPSSLRLIARTGSAGSSIGPSWAFP